MPNSTTTATPKPRTRTRTAPKKAKDSVAPASQESLDKLTEMVASMDPGAILAEQMEQLCAAANEGDEEAQAMLAGFADAQRYSDENVIAYYRDTLVDRPGFIGTGLTVAREATIMGAAGVLVWNAGKWAFNHVRDLLA
jgi:predicted NBD/HSP70 family sugar kinase